MWKKEGFTQSNFPTFCHSPSPFSNSLVHLSLPNLSISCLIAQAISYFSPAFFSLPPSQTLWTFWSPSSSSNSRLAQLMQEAGGKQMLQGGHEDTSTLRQVAQA